MNPKLTQTQNCHTPRLASCSQALISLCFTSFHNCGGKNTIAENEQKTINRCISRQNKEWQLLADQFYAAFVLGSPGVHSAFVFVEIVYPATLSLQALP